MTIIVVGLAECAKKCRIPFYGYPLGKTCYGFSYKNVSGTCMLSTTFDYDLGQVGQNEEVDHYRRRYDCRK